MLEIYNSQTRRKEKFEPIDPEGKRVGLYYCGPTVYDSAHLGHARAAVVPDLMRRYLEYRGYQVRFVANITDVDDKIIRRAIREQRDWREITSYYLDEYIREMIDLGNRPADVYPRATDHIPEMIDLVERLLEAKNAYVASNGDVYFDTHSFEGYLSLSGRNLEDQESGRSGRLSNQELEAKRNPADFILWKLLANDPQELLDHPEAVPGWSSPWGEGRPGWHLECSALSRRYLGMPFDIHGGGRDLIFPHHENEKAQNDCAYCQELHGGESVRYWVHNAFVTLKAETEAERADENTVDGVAKMSKSLGNVKWLREMIWPHGPFDPQAVRMLMIQSHYRSPLGFGGDLLEQAMSRVDRLYTAAERLGGDGSEAESGTRASDEEHASPSSDAANLVERATKAFEAAMDDDFNTPRALAAIDELINGSKSMADASPADRRAVLAALGRLSNVLGLRVRRPKAAVATTSDGEEQLLQLLGELRRDARAEKNWALSDQIRDRLAAAGFVVRDTKDGGFEIERQA